MAEQEGTEERARELAREWAESAPGEGYHWLRNHLISRLAPLLGEVERLRENEQDYKTTIEQMNQAFAESNATHARRVATLTIERDEARQMYEGARRADEAHVAEAAARIRGLEERERKILAAIEAFPESAVHTVHEQVWKRNLQIAIRAALSGELAPGKEAQVGCGRPDGTLNIHVEATTCEVCAPAPKEGARD